MTFCGFRSRCTTPAAWAAASASAICQPMRKRIAELQRPAEQLRRQRLSLDVLHDDERLAAEAADVVDGDDAGMIQCRRNSSFVGQPLGGKGVGPSLGGHELDRHQAIEPRVESAVDVSHAPFSEEAV